jgi:hypothetical protein
MTAPASAGDSSLVNVTITDVGNGNQVVILQNVAVPVAAAVCGVDIAILSAQLVTGQPVACPALTTATQAGAVTLV